MGLCPQTILPVLLQFGVHTAKPILAGEEIQVEDVHDTPEPQRTHFFPIPRRAILFFDNPYTSETSLRTALARDQALL